MKTLQKIESHITARAFGAVMVPIKEPAVRETLVQLMEVQGASNPVVVF